MYYSPVKRNLTPNPSPSHGEGARILSANFELEATLSYEPSWQSRPQTWTALKDAVRDHRRRPTSAEGALWDILRGRRTLGLKFRRQHAIGSYIVDFYCASA